MIVTAKPTRRYCPPRGAGLLRRLAVTAAATCLIAAALPARAEKPWPDRSVLPVTPPAYGGTANRILQGSRPAWAPDLKAPAALRTSWSWWSMIRQSLHLRRARLDADA
jgi:hypothetical protein